MDRASAQSARVCVRRALALSGPMGVGKSTIGRRIAERTGVPFIDIDDEIARAAGRSVAEIFRVDGEPAFRARERMMIAKHLAEGPKVIALGGGAVVDDGIRRQLIDRSILVTLDAPAEIIADRLGAAGVAKRPLLAGGSPVERLRALIGTRAGAYAECHARIATGERSVDEVAADVIALWQRDPVAVALGERSYRIEIGAGVRHELPATLALLGGQVILVTDDRAWPAVEGRLGDLTFAARVVLPSGEVHKTIESVARVWDAALERGIDRRAVILAVGGGVVGDLAGFAAATLLRGVRFVQVPTTLLAMVDASVGGKTAIDRPQGKNLVGAFHQPSAVLADTELLETLPARELRSGLAEVAKTALIADGALLDALERIDVSTLDAKGLAAIVRASIACKARVVAEDERDVTGARAALNFGHTVGHALEAHGDYSRLTHGEAVALGMIAALRIGVARGVTRPDLLERARALLTRLGLPTDLDREPLFEALPRIASDKKREGAKIAFVLLEDVGRTRNERLSLEEARAALSS